MKYFINISIGLPTNSIKCRDLWFNNDFESMWMDRFTFGFQNCQLLIQIIMLAPILKRIKSFKHITNQFIYLTFDKWHDDEFWDRHNWRTRYNREGKIVWFVYWWRWHYHPKQKPTNYTRSHSVMWTEPFRTDKSHNLLHPKCSTLHTIFNLNNVNSMVEHESSSAN